MKKHIKPHVPGRRGAFLVALAVAIKLIDIQVVDGDKYRALAEARTERMFTIPANRGNLYAGDGSLLATSVPKYDIRFDALAPTDEDFEANIAALGKGLSRILDKESSYYVNLMRRARVNKNRYLFITRDLGYSEYMEVKNLPLLIKAPIRAVSLLSNILSANIH